MKKVIKAIWHGIKAVFTTIVDWVATLLGMKENSKYGRVLHCIVGTAFAIVLILWVTGTLVSFCRSVYWNVADLCGFDDRYSEVSLSETFNDNLYYYEDYWSDKGYLTDSNGHKLLKHISCIAKPMEGDSLVYFSDGDKRGYFHMRDGHLVVKPIYEHAWVFSNGLAAVEVKGKVKFINSEGQVVIDRSFAYDEADDGYVFHEGHCAVNDSTGKHMGLIDHSGNWVLPPIYNSIIPKDTFWLVSLKGQQSLLTFGLDTVIPMTDASFEIGDTDIIAVFGNHSLGIYSKQGKLLERNLVYNIEHLMYDTREVRYATHSISDDEEYYVDSAPEQIRAIATCLRYEAENGWYGLMSPEGKQLTMPSYSRITAVDKDLYLCENSYGNGILLNSKGVLIR